MGIIAKPFTFADGTVIVAANLNSDYDAIYSEFNGNIDNANIKAGAGIDGAKLLASSVTAAQLANNSVTSAKIDYTSVLFVRGSVAGLKLARGSKAFTMPAGAAHNFTITFSTDSTDGNPAFGSVPKLVGTVFVAGAGTVAYRWRIESLSTTSCVIHLNSSDAADARSGTFEWIAVGT